MRCSLAGHCSGPSTAKVGIGRAIGRVGGVPIRRGGRRWRGGIGRRFPLVYHGCGRTSASAGGLWEDEMFARQRKIEG